MVLNLFWFKSRQNVFKVFGPGLYLFCGQMSQLQFFRAFLYEKYLVLCIFWYTFDFYNVSKSWWNGLQVPVPRRVLAVQNHCLRVPKPKLLSTTRQITYLIKSQTRFKNWRFSIFFTFDFYPVSGSYFFLSKHAFLPYLYVIICYNTNQISWMNS